MDNASTILEIFFTSVGTLVIFFGLSNRLQSESIKRVGQREESLHSKRQNYTLKTLIKLAGLKKSNL